MSTKSGPAKSEISTQNTLHRTPAFEPLEPRLLLSADLIGTEPLVPPQADFDQQALVADVSGTVAPAGVPAQSGTDSQAALGAEAYAAGLTPEFGPEQHVKAGGADIQVTGYSVPVLADWNADGRPDLLVGEKFDTVSGKVRVYLNSGTAAAPVFGSFSYAKAAGSDLTVPTTGCLGAYPRVYDWNQDGKKDLLIGLADGTIRVYLNTGTAANPSFGSGSTIQAGAAGAKADIDVGDRATFDIVDWNNDGAGDLVAGALDGKVRVYLNRQTTGAPDLASPTAVQEGASDLLVPSGRSSVDVYDLNGDGRKDLVLGNTDAQVIFYPNAGTDAAPVFTSHEILLAIAGGSRSRPLVADFNADGVPDLFVGNVDGLVRYYLGASAGDDPTVGYTTVFPNVSEVANRRAVPYVMNEAGSIESISIYHQGGTGHAILAVYADNAGKPGARLGVTASTVINDTEGWQTIPLQSPVTASAGQTIWLAWVFENDPGLRWAPGTPGRAMSPATWSGGMPDSFGVSTSYDGIYSIYAAYTSQGADQTIGNTTVFSQISTTANRRAAPYTVSEAGVLESISIYHQGGTGHLIMAVYADNAGKPGTRLGVTASTVINGAEGWQTINLLSPVSVSSGQKIWLAWVFENMPGIRFRTGTPGRAESSALWSGGMPEAFGSSTVAGYIYSIYGTYSTGSDVTAPANVSNFAAVAGDGRISLSWTNPGDTDFAGVKILRKAGGYPGSPTDGTVVYDGTGTGAIDTGLTNGTKYYYKAFSYDEVPNYSSGATVSGTPVTATDKVGNTTVFPQISTIANRRAMPFVMDEAGSLTSVSIYHQGGTGHVILAVYADDAGKPGTRLGVTASTVINGAEGWQTISLQSPVAASAGQTIWLAWVFENDPGLRWTPGTPGRALSPATWSGGMPTSFGVSSSSDGIYSIYATYSPGGEAPVQVTVDNLDPGASSTGEWYASGAPNPWSENSMVSWVPGSTFKYTADLAAGTAYNVYAWWTASSCRYNAVQYQIRSGSTLLGTVSVDQKINGGQWNLLGVYTFTGVPSVTVLAAPSTAYSASADAIRFVPVA